MLNFQRYTGERASNSICGRLRKPYYPCRVNNVRKIRETKHRRVIEKFSFVIRTIKNSNQLPAEALRLSLVNLRFLETEF